MKKMLKFVCILIVALMCATLFCTGCEKKNQTNIFELFVDEQNYTSHFYGGFGGLTSESEGSVRILAEKCSTSNGHIGFMLKKEAIESMVAENCDVVSFKITTEAYDSNPVPGFVDVYASGVNVENYQLSIENGKRNGSEDIYYPSDSVVTINLVNLVNDSKFTEGLKFILKKAAAPGNAAGAPAYLVLSDFEFISGVVAKTPFEQMVFDESYDSYKYGEFGGVTKVNKNSVKILAKENNGVSGFMLTKNAVEKLLQLRANEMTVTLKTSAYESGSKPEYIVLDSPAAVDYVVNYKTAATKVERNKLYFTPGTKITLRLDKLYADIDDENGLKFALLNGSSWEDGGTTAYLTLDNMVFAERFQDTKYDIVCTNGDFLAYYEKEPTWAEMTEKSIRAVAKAGFKYIDLSLYRIRSDSDLMKDGWEDIVNNLKDVADVLDVEFRMAHSPGYTSFGSDEWIATNKRSIDICNMLGIENLVVHVATSTSKYQFFKLNTNGYGYILPYAAEKGVNILCENSTSKNTGSAWCINDGANMREFIKYVQDELGYTNFHGCWDTGHANCEGSQYLDILALGDEMYAIHFHDNLGSDSHMIPYYGNMNIDEVMRALKVIGYSGDFTLETDGSSRIGPNYTGPELSDDLDPYTKDRFEQQEIIYQIITHILEKYDCLK